MNTTNRISGKGQLWLSPTRTGNKNAENADTALALGIQGPDSSLKPLGCSTHYSHSSSVVPVLLATLKSYVNHNCPTISRVFSISGRTSPIPSVLPRRNFCTTSEI
ncbi:hypothetical protein AMECASPLE_031167 [Ameca splendens]|uniref:Uncharacterized protein n=1 Tax=Ameca splendens TaxID=208324 RepID=A0ABV0Z4Z9_9TELE